MNRHVLPILGAVVLATACTEKKSAEPTLAEAPKEAPVAVVNDAATTSVIGRADPDCVGPIDTGVPETLKIGDRTVELNGYKLTLTGAAAEGHKPVIGVLANINEASPENLFQLERYLGFFKEKGAELLVVAGDSGEKRDQIATVLDKVGESGLPVLAIIGNRESRADFVDAVQEVRKTRANVINGNRVRYVDWQGVDLITLPGYHDPTYMHAGNAGCQYFKQDVAGLKKLAAGANDPVLLVAHGQPLGEAPTALDVIATDKKHVGDANLTAAIADAKIPFGVFANIKETGGTATADVGGKNVVAAGTQSDTLYLNPGSVDGLEWGMNDGSTSFGSAAVLTFEGGKASYELHRATRLTAEERAEAVKKAGGAKAATAQTE